MLTYRVESSCRSHGRELAPEELSAVMAKGVDDGLAARLLCAAYRQGGTEATEIREGHLSTLEGAIDALERGRALGWDLEVALNALDVPQASALVVSL